MSMSSLLLCMIVGALGLANIVASKDEAKFYELKQGNLSVKFTNLGARIGAQFTLNETHYNVTANYGKNTLNGGHKGFGYQVWKVTSLKKEKSYSQITFTHKSSDREEGFPGNLSVAIKFTVQAEELVTEVHAHTENKATPVNLGQHVVWNLGGHNSGNILSHGIQIFGSNFIDVDQGSFITTGKVLPVKGIPYDFLKPHAIGSRIKKTGDGYKLNYVLNNGPVLKLAAILHERKSGRILKLWTTQATLLFSTANQMKVKGKGGFLYQSHAGCGLDPQGYPDSFDHHNFPSKIITKDKPYKQRTVFKFSNRA